MFENVETHPSWGMIGAYHTSGGARQLFGSDVSNHNTIVIRVKHAQKHRELGRDWTMGTDTICEVELSALQFAEFLTNMNVGDGAPCTVRYTRNDGDIMYQPEKSRVDVILAERDSIVDRASSSLQEVHAELQELVKNKKISKSTGDKLLHKLYTAMSDLEGNNYEFYRKQAEREVSELVVEAKSQISEYVATKIYSVGLETLVNAAEVTPQLNGAPEEE